MGQPLPDRIANAPELYSGLEIYLQAFFDLDSERSHGMGIQLIPWSAIKHYALMYEFSEDQSEDLMYFIRKMDIAHTNKLKSKSKLNGQKST